jgi:hypothetical protein
MVARARSKAGSAASALFGIAERQLIGLYDAGLLSPAILQHTLAAFSGEAVEWNATSSARSVDKRSLAEIVVLTMMPGRALRNAQKDYLSVVAHIVDARADIGAEEEPEDADHDEALLAQLSGNKSTTRAKTPRDDAAAQKKNAAFSPLAGARGVSGRGKQ